MDLVSWTTLVVWGSAMQETPCFTGNTISTAKSRDSYLDINRNLSFIFQMQFTSYQVGQSHNSAAWLKILAVEVGQVPPSFSPLILIGPGNCELQLAGGKLECTHMKDYIHTIYGCVHVSHTCERDRMKERLRHPAVRMKSLWAFGCSAGEDKAVWCLLTWPMIHNWGRTAVAGCADRPQGEWQMIGPSGAELSISPNVHCLLSAYLYFL